jgi:hypothetical protein
MAGKLTLEVGSIASSLDLWGECGEETTVRADACNIGATTSRTDGRDCWGKLLYTISHR